jgi:nucleoside-diphosphate-sugar epimerase
VDLSDYAEEWAELFAGVDTVLHVAANPSPCASWARMQSLNIDPLLNVMAAVQRHHVRRVVFASSNFVVAGHRFAPDALTTTMAPSPINPYGASKLFSERLGKMFAECYGVSFIAFRIGVCQRAHGNHHELWIPYGAWVRRCG